jgi:hypothetical protein
MRGRGDFNGGTEVSPLTTTKCYLSWLQSRPEGTHQSARPSLKGTMIIRGGEDFNAGTEVSPLTTTKCCLDEELSPIQAGEVTPECQTIVKRYKDNKVGRLQRRKRGVATNN